MNIAICIKQVPDTETKIRLNSDQTVDFANVKWIINPYDEFAIEEGLKLKEKNPNSTTTVFSVGPAKRVSEALRTALAMGVDNAVAIDAGSDLGSLGTALALSSALRSEGPFDVVFVGRTAIDDNQSAVGPMLAQCLEIPHASFVSKLESAENHFLVECEQDSGRRISYQINWPCLVTCNKGLNSPRYASLPGIMKAKKKVIKEIPASPSGITLRFENFQMPPEKSPVQMLKGDSTEQVKELVRTLRENAKVL